MVRCRQFSVYTAILLPLLPAAIHFTTTNFGFHLQTAQYSRHTPPNCRHPPIILAGKIFLPCLLVKTGKRACREWSVDGLCLSDCPGCCHQSAPPLGQSITDCLFKSIRRYLATIRYNTSNFSLLNCNHRYLSHHINQLNQLKQFQKIINSGLGLITIKSSQTIFSMFPLLANDNIYNFSTLENQNKTVIA